MAENNSSLTDGSLIRPMAHLMVPILVMGLLQSSYNLVDLFWLGRLSTEAVGAISLSFPLIFLVISAAAGFIVGGSTLVAQYTGAGNRLQASRVTGQTITISLIVSVGLGLLGALFAGPIFRTIPINEATSHSVIPLTIKFVTVFFIGLPTLFVFSSFTALMRGYGDTRTPMIVMAFTILLNLALDPLLIFGFGPISGYGIAGAAGATVAARGVGVVIGLYLLFLTETGISLRATDLVLTREISLKILKIGIPSSLEDSSTSLAITLVAFYVATFSPAVVAAYGIGTRVLSFGQMIGDSFGQAANATVGQNLGSEQPQRAKSAIFIATSGVLVLTAIFGILLFVYSESLSRFFLVSNSTVTRDAVVMSSRFLRILAMGFVFTGLFETVLGAYRGAGNTRSALAFSLVGLWIGRVGIILYLTKIARFGATGIWIGMIASSVLGALISTIWLFKGTWTDPVIDVENAD